MVKERKAALITLVVLIVALFFVNSAYAFDINLTSPNNVSYTSLPVNLNWSTATIPDFASFSLNGADNFSVSVNERNYVENLTEYNDSGWANIPYGVASAIDGDWSTYGVVNTVNIPDHIYMNYTKPTLAKSAEWMVKLRQTDNVATCNTTLIGKNHTVPTACFNQDKIMLSVIVYKPIEDVYSDTNISCWNGSEWYLIEYYFNAMSWGCDRLSEEAMYFNVSPKDAQLNVTQGHNNITVWANDTGGTANSTTVHFYVDTLTPNITNPTYPASCLQVPGTINLNWYQSDNLDDLTTWCNISNVRVGSTTNTANSSASCSAVLITAGQIEAIIFVQDLAGNTDNFTTYITGRLSCGGSSPPPVVLGGGGGSPILPPLNITILRRPECPEGQTYDIILGRCRERDPDTPAAITEEYILAPRLIPIAVDFKNVTVNKITGATTTTITSYSTYLFSWFQVLLIGIVLGYAAYNYRVRKRFRPVDKLMIGALSIFIIISLSTTFPPDVWFSLLGGIG